MRSLQNFTAVPSKVENIDINESVEDVSYPGKRLLQSSTDKIASGSAGIFRDKYLLCNTNNKREKREPLGQFENDSAASNIKRAAQKLSDHVMLNKIGDNDLFAKEVKYHHSVKNNYTKKPDNVATKMHVSIMIPLLQNLPCKYRIWSCPNMIMHSSVLNFAT